MNTITVRTIPTRALMEEPLYYPMSLFDDIEGFVSDIWDTWTPAVYDSNVHPRLDMFEIKDELVTRVELPGLKKEDISVKLEDGRLSISAEKKGEKLSEDATYYTSERYFGQYSRTLSLPFPVDSEKISATFENGLLEIRMPKAEEAKAKQIEIKVK